MDRPLSLVGLMGAGKSTVGRRLAARLHLGFLDVDQEIERAASLSIPEIFARFGEAAFRDGERRVIARLVEETPQVIATGGGAFMNAETRRLLLARTVVIWLDADVTTLVERVGRRGGRPLLEGQDPHAVLERLAAERNPVYAQAHLRVESVTAPHEAMVDAIIALLERRRAGGG